MKKLLRINSSILGDNSVSNQLMAQVLDALQQADGHWQVTERDFSQTPIPHLDSEWLQALTTPDADRTDAQQEKVDFSDSLIRELQEADLVVIGLPMYNFSVPSMLKSWNDHVARAGVTFKYTESGPQGLLGDKKVLLIASTGGEHDNDGGDFLRPYMRHFLGFLGIHDIDIISASGLNLGEAPRQQALQKAEREIQEWAHQMSKAAQLQEDAA